MTQEIFDEIDENEDGRLFEHFRYEVDPGQKMLRIDKFLVNRMEGTSRNRIQAASDAGCIMANGQPVKSSYKVKPNDIITIVLDYPKRELKIIDEDIPLNVVYEDEHLLVVNKPAGLVVHPGHGNYTGTLVNALAYRFKGLPLFNSEDPRPGLVHRIDKDTSGLLVVAKTEQAKLHLSMQFYNKTTKRAYQALIWGIPTQDEGTVTGNIGRSPKNRQVLPFSRWRAWQTCCYPLPILKTGLCLLGRMQARNRPDTSNQGTYETPGAPALTMLTAVTKSSGTTFTKYKQFVQNCFHSPRARPCMPNRCLFIQPQAKKCILNQNLSRRHAQLIENGAYTLSRPEE